MCVCVCINTAITKRKEKEAEMRNFNPFWKTESIHLSQKLTFYSRERENQALLDICPDEK